MDRCNGSVRDGRVHNVCLEQQASFWFDSMNPLLSDTHTFIIVLIPPKTIDLLYRLKHEMLSTEDEAIAPLLPNTLEELKAYERVSVGREGHIQRDLDWIKKNGTSRMTRQKF